MNETVNSPSRVYHDRIWTPSQSDIDIVTRAVIIERSCGIAFLQRTRAREEVGVNSHGQLSGMK